VNIRADLKGTACRRKTAALGRLFFFGGAERLLLAALITISTRRIFHGLEGGVARHQARVATSLTQPAASRVAPRMRLQLNLDLLIDSPG
jgi:hypothetical protein